jgi:lysophospholipase L1-like esterase
MRFARPTLLAVVVTLVASTHAVAGPRSDASRFALADGDRVVFFGDSITEQRLYTTYVQHFVVTRFPDRTITFVNSGWGGDQTSSNDCDDCHGVGALARIERDVVAKRPTVVTLLFGMNDGKYRDFDPAVLKTYQDGMSEIIRILKTRTKARIYVMTPTVYDGTRHTSWSHTDKYNDVLDRYSEAAKAIAAREGLPVIDLHEATVAALARAKAAEPDYTFVPDGVHPNEDGQLVMATEILKAWGATSTSARADVTARAGAEIVVDVTAPLPWPSPRPSARLAGVRPDIAELGSVKLSVTGLAPGSYAVSVHGADAGTFTAEQLSNGVGVLGASRAALEHSDAVAALLRKREDTMFLGWRNLQVPLATYAHTAAAVRAVDAVAADMAERARTDAGAHTYHLVLKRV